MTKVLKELKVGEVVYIVVGALFLLNSFYISIDGGFGLLLLAKGIYMIGLILILIDR